MISIFKNLKYINSAVLASKLSVIAGTELNMSLPTADSLEINSLKRQSSDNLDNPLSSKKPLTEKPERVKRKKVAMMITYMGQGYLGLQRNPGTKTIEEDFMVALLKAGYINDEIFNQPQVINFQRAARTDKGVSALRQILSLKMPENSSIEAINEHLPPQIRAIAMKRVTKGFNSKSNCDARTYSYTSPTFAFAEHGSVANEEYRLNTETQQKVTDILKMYEGTHNFHNFTSKKQPTDPSAHRYIMNFACGNPYVVDDLEFVTLKVKGQSFMLHQIRKMVGLTIAIVRGLTGTETLTRSYDKDKLDIPMAPGLGLLLEEVHYDRYNQRYGSDGMHETMEWSKWDEEVESFRKKLILPTVINTEKNEKSMLSWLDTLNLHSFDVRTEHIHSELDRELERNKMLLSPPRNVDALITPTVETAG